MKRILIFIFVMFLFASSTLASDISIMEKYIDENYSVSDSHEIAMNIWTKSKKEDVDPILVLAIAEQESSFRPKAVSKVHARGLMQVRWCVWSNYLREREFQSYRQLHDVEKGIEAGIHVLKYYLEKYDLEDALYLYSGGYSEYVEGIQTKMESFKEFKKKQSPWYAE